MLVNTPAKIFRDLALTGTNATPPRKSRRKLFKITQT
jgi:hypothetical protein